MYGLRSLASGTSILAFMPCLSLTPRANAMPTTSVDTSLLYSAGSNGTGVIFWVSRVNETFLGHDATDFDYYTPGDPTGSIESLLTFGRIFATGNPDDLLVALLNATMGGTMTPEQVNDQEWKCRELSGDMASKTAAGEGVDTTSNSTDVPQAGDLARRGRWTSLRNSWSSMCRDPWRTVSIRTLAKAPGPIVRPSRMCELVSPGQRWRTSTTIMPSNSSRMR